MTKVPEAPKIEKEAPLKEAPIKEEKVKFSIKLQEKIQPLPEIKDKTKIDLRYPLIIPYAYAHIYWDEVQGELIYYLEEPNLDKEEKETLNLVKQGIEELINMSFISVKEKENLIEYLEKNVSILLKELDIKLEKNSYLKIMYYIYRDFVGLNRIEPLMNDYYIEDIECNGKNSPVYIVHRKLGNIKTNIIYEDFDELTDFVEKLAQKCGKYISYATPLLDARLPEGSRINATFTEDVTSKGPTFCFTDGYLQLGNGEVTKIEELFKKCKNNFGFKIENGNEVVEVNNITCCGVNEKNLNQINSNLKTIIKLKPPKKLVCVKFKDGAKITTTTNHLFHIADSNLNLVEANKLKEGMFVPMPSKINIKGCMQIINTSNLIKDFSYLHKVCIVSSTPIKKLINNTILDYKSNFRNHKQQFSQEYGVHNSYFYEIINRGTSISFEILDKICSNINNIGDLSVVVYGSKTREKSKAVKVPKEVDEDLSYLAGAIISDGHIARESIYICSFEEGFRNAIISKLIKKFGKADVYYNGNRVYLCNLFVPYFFNNVFGIPYGKKSNIVKIPKIIFKSDDKVIASFIKGLFDGDRTCKSGLSYKTNSKELAEGLTYLLSRLGIYSKITFKYNTYKVNIPSIYEAIYANKTGFNNKPKLSYLNELLNKKYSYAKSYINNGRVPAKPVLELIKKLSLSKNRLVKLCNVSYNRLIYYDSLSKPFVRQMIPILESEINKKNIKDNNLNYIKWLVNCNQEFVKIDSIDIFDNINRKPVYDIELEPYKFFIAGNKPMNVFDTVRKFTKEPWSPIKLMQVGSVSAELLAYLWLLVENGSNILIVGGTGSGKTTFLNTLAFFIPPQERIISIEDSVTANAKIIIKKKNNKIKQIKIGKLIDKIKEKKLKPNFKILTLDDDYKIKFVKPSSYIRHKVKKDIYKITTSTGRNIEVTEDHSLFSLGKFGLKEVKPLDLKIKKSYIAVPRTLPIENKPLKIINLIKYLKIFETDFLTGKPLSKLFQKYKRKDLNIKKSRYQHWKNNNLIKIKKLLELDLKFDKEDLKRLHIKSKNITKLPVLFKLTDDFLKFIGLWLGDGSYDNFNANRVIISNSDEECIDLVQKISKELNINISKMNDSVSRTLNSTILYKFMKFCLKLDGYSATKKIPELIFNLSNNQIKELIKGYFSADGTVKKYEITCTSQSIDLLEDLQTFLLRLDIIGRINNLRKDKCRQLSISSYNNINRFKKIGFLQERKNLKMKCIGLNKATHDISDIIPLNFKQKEFLKVPWGYLKGGSNIGRMYLQNIAPSGSIFNDLSHSDILWDKIVKIEKLKNKERYVYDISVPKFEKFICSNIFVHNTRELALAHENWLPAVARAGITTTGIKGGKTGEITLFDLLKESFRQRPDYVIVGEIRGSIRGSEEVVVIKNGLMQRIPIEKLEKENMDNLFVPTLNLDNKIKFSKVYDFIKHKSNTSLIKIKTRSGREVTITPQHSLFTIKDLLIKPIEADELKKGSKILIPSKIPCGFNDIKYLNIFQLMPESRVECDINLIRRAISIVGQKNSDTLLGCVARQYCRSIKAFMEFYKFDKLMRKANIRYHFDNLRARNGNSSSIPSQIKVNDSFLKFLGYYISEGYSIENRRTIVITNSNEKVLNDVLSICETEFGIKPYTRIVKGLGTSTQVIINNPILTKLISRLGCGRISDEKRMPSFIYGLNKQKIGMFLKGLFTGDGCFDGNEIMFFSKSRKLVEDVSYALLIFGIVARISKFNNCWRLRFKGREEILTFLNEIGFVKKIPIFNSTFSRYSCNTIKFEPEILEQYIHIPRKYRHLRRHKSCSKKYLARMINETGANNEMSKLANGEFYIDEIKEVEEITLNKPEYVYDFAVLPAHNFIGGFGGLILHNTEAYVLFQGMASGHASLSTMHADDIATVIRRLQTPPINLSPSLVETLDAICLMTFAKVKGKETRKLRAIEEIINVSESGKAQINIPFKWDPMTNKFLFKKESHVLDKLVVKKGIKREQLDKEFSIRSRLLLKLYKEKIVNFEEVQKIIHAYYKTPEKVLKRFNIK